MYVARSALIGASALLSLLIGAAVVLLARQGDDSPATLERYYFEARLEVEHRTPGSSATDAEPRRDLVRAWYEAPDKWRREYAYSDPLKRDLSLVDVSDGEQMWTYDGVTNTYTIRELPEQLSDRPELLQQYASSVVLPFSFVLGPLPVDDMNTFFARYQLGGASWRSIGTERLLNRDVQVVEVQQGAAKTTFWIDPRYTFVLRYVAEGDGSSIRAEVVDLAYGEAIDPETFAFEPPHGAREAALPAAGSSQSEATGSATLGGSGPTSVPARFLAPSYVPAGYGAVGQGSSSSGSGQTTRVYIRLQPSAGTGDTPFLLIEEQFRAGGLPDSLQSGTAVPVGGNTAYRSDQGGETRLRWSVGDIVITLSTDSLPLEELQRVGESMR